ncbi:LCP family glycopolymer transferase [Paenibacillus ihbetae]|uniref:Cell envelope-related transcriptional attenuator domain-containing protein n=1 Tax=Paenibacillus ihbetae TaxID=1870820 RepID=A0A1B2E3S0_9BACL|nr:LCP family protein [Paenibacillus ihbetae]ANY74552.1 hypothetical protein BBD41_19350 [Paenibacillus ihbetae]OOC63277.1 hypothetical protein BBD40_16265 [Paenibacillus ihbetae]
MRIWRKWWIWLLIVLVVVPAGYVTYVYQSIKSTAHQIYEEREEGLPPAVPVTTVEQKIRVKPDKLKNADQPVPFTVLMLGVDERPNDRGRSDTLMLMAVNPAKGSIMMFNVPRDTRTSIVGHGKVDKINHAYAFGGVDMSIRSVENFLQYPIDYYVKVNMEGFSQIIDSLGGVTVNNQMAFDYAGHHFGEGVLKLSGEEALAFSRMRFEDPKGDLGRNARQREIIKGVLDNAMKVTTVFKLEALLDDVGGSVKTDISFDEMKRFVTDYMQKLERIDQVEIQGRGQIIDGIWYYIVDQNEKARIHSLLSDFMGS